MADIRLLSVQAGVIETFGEFDALDPHDQKWTTAFVKRPVNRPVSVGWLGIAGDEQADRRFHGGPDKALLAYSGDHFAFWRTEIGRDDLSGGAFGENLTVTGQTEADVCIGDAWRIGDVLLEVTQPRQPCWKLGRRWREARLPKWVIARGWTGWYFRVLEEGSLEAGLALTLERRPHAEWTILAANRVMYSRRAIDAPAIRRLIALPELSQAWKDELGERVLV